MEPKQEGNKGQQWLISADGTINNLEQNRVLSIESDELFGGRLTCKEKGVTNQQFALEVFQIGENEYNKHIFY